MAHAYLRYPHLHDDLVAFTAADDIWLAPASGGRAWRLTDDAAPVTNPRFSPDGSKVAWTSTRDGHSEAMVIDVDGGASERLTWFGSAVTSVLGWTADGRVLVASGHLDGPRRRLVAHAVALNGTVERLAYGPTSGLAIHRKGAVALSTPWSRPPALWKRYRGGTAPRLWLDPKGKGKWQRLLPDEAASLVSPMWIGDDLVFASDLEATFPDRADGQANLWALGDRGTGELRPITHHTVAEGYVRDPATDGERIVYHARGEVYRLDSLDSKPARLDISLGGSLAGRRRRAIVPTQDLSEIRPDRGANASLVDWRGKAFYLAHREGPARAIAADSAVRARCPRLIGDSGTALVVHQLANGDDEVQIHDLTGTAEPRSIAATGVGRIVHVEIDPAGTAAVAISHDGTVRHLDLGRGRWRVLSEQRRGEPMSITFSPDSRYVAWSQPVADEGNHQIVGVDLTARKPAPVELTSGKFNDTSPSFSRDGKYLVFISARTFDPVYDAYSFDLTFPGAQRPYLVPLSATEPAPFGPSADGWRISPDEPASPTTAKESGAPAPTNDAPVSPDWDVDGFEERIVAFPVPSADYRDLQTVKDGVDWVHVNADQGVLGARRAGVADEPADVIEHYSFTGRKLEVLVPKATGFAVSGDGQRIVVRDGDAVTVRPADRAVKPDEPDCVTVDLARLRFELDPMAEWMQMFDETVTLMTQNYWRADMNGVDWPGVTEHYREAVGRVASHDDLVDILWEVVGELNSSHAYVQPPAPAGDASRQLGLLGADLTRTANGWRIDRILPGESSDPDARSPLRAAGVGAKPGDVIVAVGGQPVDDRFGPAASLVGAANQPIELTLRSGKTTRRTVVVPLADEQPLRYQDWVRGRAAYVAEHGRGRLGYVHIPDMMGVGWAQLHRDLHRAVRHEGVIVDVRYNGGGHTSQLVLERLAKKVVGWVTSRNIEAQQEYPSDALRGPVVLVTNEMAGSDGDIVNAAAQAMGIGPVVGVRTWGGVIGIDGRYSLVDGTGVTQPKYSFWLQGKEWGVENHGVDPDIEVEIAPAEILTEDRQDRQLDRAIAEAFARLEATPAATPPPLPAPRVR